MANLNRDEWPLQGDHTKMTGSSTLKTTQIKKLPTQSDKSSAKEKADVTSTSKKSGDKMGEDAKELSPFHRGVSIKDDASRATTSQPRDTDPSDHHPSSQRSKPKPKPKPNSGNDISSGVGVRRHPKVLHDYDDRKDYYMPDKAGRLEEEVMNQASSSKKERRRG